MQTKSFERLNLIKSQLIPCGIGDKRLLMAMQEIPREFFTQHFMEKLSYKDDEITFPNGRFMLSPLALAQMIDGAAIQAHDKILDIGCTTGYSTTVLSFMAKSVFSIESDKDMAEIAQENLIEMGSTDAKVHQADLPQGYPEKAPFDVIIIQGQVENIPEALLSQLSENGGRLLTAKGLYLISITRTGNTFSQTTLETMITSPLPPFCSPQKFVF